MKSCREGAEGEEEGERGEAEEYEERNTQREREILQVLTMHDMSKTLVMCYTALWRTLREITAKTGLCYIKTI